MAFSLVVLVLAVLKVSGACSDYDLDEGGCNGAGCQWKPAGADTCVPTTDADCTGPTSCADNCLDSDPDPATCLPDPTKCPGLTADSANCKDACQLVNANTGPCSGTPSGITCYWSGMWCVVQGTDKLVGCAKDVEARCVDNSGSGLNCPSTNNIGCASDADAGCTSIPPTCKIDTSGCVRSNGCLDSQIEIGCTATPPENTCGPRSPTTVCGIANPTLETCEGKVGCAYDGHVGTCTSKNPTAEDCASSDESNETSGCTDNQITRGCKVKSGAPSTCTDKPKDPGDPGDGGSAFTIKTPLSVIALLVVFLL